MRENEGATPRDWPAPGIPSCSCTFPACLLDESCSLFWKALGERFQGTAEATPWKTEALSLSGARCLGQLPLERLSVLGTLVADINAQKVAL